MPPRLGNGALDQMIASASYSAGMVGAWDRDFRRGRVDRTDSLSNLNIPAGREQESSFDDFLRAVHPLDRARVKRIRDAAVQRGGEYRCDYRLLTPSGIKTVRAIGRSYNDQQGRPLRFLGIFMEICDDDAHFEAERSLDRIVASTQEAYEACDHQQYPVISHLLQMLLLELSNPQKASPERLLT